MFEPSSGRSWKEELLEEEREKSEERRDWGEPEFLLDSFAAGEEGGVAGRWGGWSEGGWRMPSSQMGSGLLSGAESVSKMYLTARAGIAERKLGGSLTFEDEWELARMLESERSLDEALKVWLNQPEMRVGRSDSRDELADEYSECECVSSDAVLRGRSARVRARVIGTAPGGSASSTTTLAPGESASGAERDRSLAFFCRNRGSFDGAGDDGDDMSHVTVTRHVRYRSRMGEQSISVIWNACSSAL